MALCHREIVLQDQNVAPQQRGVIFKDELQIGHVMLIDSTIYGRFDICEPLRPACVRCEDRWNLRPRVPVLGTGRDHSSRALRRDHPQLKAAWIYDRT